MASLLRINSRKRRQNDRGGERSLRVGENDDELASGVAESARCEVRCGSHGQRLSGCAHE